jgi:UDP-3-O-[3-hydroxymyristoyl] glucosamine N-acyltransferase
MPLTTGEIAAIVEAVCEGPADRVLSGVASLEVAGPADLCFCSGGPWLRELATTRAGAVIVADGAVREGVVALRHPNPRYAFARAAALLSPVPWPSPGVHPRAEVHPDAIIAGATIDAFAVIEAGATIAAGAWVQAHAFVGAGAIIGAGCRLMPHSVVMEGVRLGQRVVLKPGAVVGADGFGYAVGSDGQVVKVPQLGTVIVEDDVEIGANSCVDRAALGATTIGAGTRLDNLVQVAHNVKIGARCLLAAFSGVAGGARLGDGVVMGGRAAVVDHVEIGDNVVLAALASASRNAPDGSKLGGSPARAYGNWLRELAALRALPAALKRLDRLEERWKP